MFSPVFWSANSPFFTTTKARWIPFPQWDWIQSRHRKRKTCRIYLLGLVFTVHQISLMPSTRMVGYDLFCPWNWVTSCSASGCSGAATRMTSIPSRMSWPWPPSPTWRLSHWAISSRRNVSPPCTRRTSIATSRSGSARRVIYMTAFWMSWRHCPSAATRRSFRPRSRKPMREYPIICERSFTTCDLLCYRLAWN